MSNQGKSVIIKLAAFIFSIHFSLMASAQFKNVKLADLPDNLSSPVGVSIAINNKDPKNMIAGIGLNQLLTTRDGGSTWTESTLESTFGAGGEPLVISDSKGNFHYFHLSDAKGMGQGNEGWLDRIVGHTYTENEGGASWDKGVSIGTNPPKNQVHPRVSRHFDLGALYLTWTQFDHYGSKDSTCQSNIFFSKSSHGKRWSDPVQINFAPGNCMDDDNTPNGAIAAINSGDRLFVVWANQERIYFDRSYTDGDTWLTNDIVIAEQPGGSFMTIPGFGKCSGRPTLVIDNSDTFFKGSLYVSYADQRNGENDADIWLTRSTNRGDSWTKPQRINRDTTKSQQFMPTITVDEATGIVYLLYYDRRAYRDSQTDVYLAYSLDGTNHFSEVKISESPFIPSAGKRSGDYIGVSANKGIIAAIWTRTDGGQNSVWTTVIRQEELFKKEDMPVLQSMKRKPAASALKPSSGNNGRRHK